MIDVQSTRCRKRLEALNETANRPTPRRDAADGEDGSADEPSICSSIRRLHSTAYSIGSVRVTGSMKPLTIMPIACSCERPRLIR